MDEEYSNDEQIKPQDLGLPSDFDLDGFTTQVKHQYAR